MRRARTGFSTWRRQSASALVRQHRHFMIDYDLYGNLTGGSIGPILTGYRSRKAAAFGHIRTGNSRERLDH